jgi:D-alanyl-D-alanine carboxypeptidase/D-alanyl-D-alanine-endopeptidase (penicillin-binding protein 4)
LIRFSRFALLGLCVLSACGGARHVAVTPLSPVESLQRDLTAIFQAPEFDRSIWSVLVRPASSSENLFSLNASKLVMPGSNMKILTLAAAADQLGWDYRYETKIVTTAPVEAGVLLGDLIVVGSGDPSISERSDEHGILQSMAQQLRDAGIRQIDGRIIGDDDAFDGQRLGEGWAWDNLPYGYSAPVTALEYNEGSVDLVIRAGAAAGDAVAIQIQPEGSGLEIENRLVTAAETANGALTLERLPGSSHLVVRGQIPAKAAPFARTASVDNPTRFFVNALRAALIAEGIQVSKGALDIDDMSSKPDRSGARTLATRLSPPLAVLATSMMKVSQNQYAELLLKTLGGRQALADRLRSLGIADDSYIIADGSGLSRYDFVTEEALVRLLQLFRDRPADRAPFTATLPVAGRDGTLARRLTGTPAEGRVRAKSGTIDNVRALSGYLDTANGDTLVFSMIANNFSLPVAQIDAAVDHALVRLVSFTQSPGAGAGGGRAAPRGPARPSDTPP